MPLLICFAVTLGLSGALMVHFVHMAIMWLKNWPDTRTVNTEYFLNRIFAGIIGSLLGLLLFLVCALLAGYFLNFI